MPSPTPVTITTINVAQAVADEMNAPTGGAVFELEFDCARVWLTNWTLAKLAKLQLGVIALSEQRTRWTRGGTERTHRIRIEFQKKLDPTASTYFADIDAQAAFVFQVEDYWMAARRKLASSDAPNIWCTEAMIKAINNPTSDAAKGMFAAILELTFVERTMQ